MIARFFNHLLARSACRQSLLRTTTLPAALCLLPAVLAAQESGFLEPDVTLFGEVRLITGGQGMLLNSGTLSLTLVNGDDPENRVTLVKALEPDLRNNLSYVLSIPFKHRPAAGEKDRFLAVSASDQAFYVDAVLVNGEPAYIAEGSPELFIFSFATRAGEYRLDLVFEQDGIIDSDGDQLPDAWEIANGTNPDFRDAHLDFDGDGWSNYEEFINGTNPFDDNRVPSLLVAELRMPQYALRGFLPQIVDSDSDPGDLLLELDFSTPDPVGLEILLDAEPVDPATPLSLTLADLETGRLALRDRGTESGPRRIGIAWEDEAGHTGSDTLVLQVDRASREDGTESSLWLDGALLGASPSLDTWPDRSGLGRAATQPLPDYQPLLADDLPWPAAGFHSPSAHLFFNQDSLPQGNHTILMAFRPEGHSLEARTVFSSTRGHFALTPSDGPVIYPDAPYYQSGNLASGGYLSLAEGMHSLALRRSGDDLVTRLPESHAAETASLLQTAKVLPTLGLRRFTGDNSAMEAPFTGTLAELLIFPSSLSDRHLGDLQDYLASKWQGALLWNESNRLTPIHFDGSPGPDIIRGGLADDTLAGGPGNDIISGGPGNDTLGGGPGEDVFSFGSFDTGDTILTDFHPAEDIIDLSGLYWNAAGDPRDWISISQEIDSTGSTPSSSTRLHLELPDNSPSRTITLQGLSLEEEEFLALLVEERIRMGGPALRSTVTMRFAENSPTQLREWMNDPATFVVERSGEAVAGAQMIPVALLNGELREGPDYLLAGEGSAFAFRIPVFFERGETIREITLAPLSDLRDEGLENWEFAPLSSRFSHFAGTALSVEVTDVPVLRLEPVGPTAVIETGEPAYVRLTRSGNLETPLTLTLETGGNYEGFVPFEEEITLASGETSRLLTIEPQAGSLPGTLLLGLQSGPEYLVLQPRQVKLSFLRESADLDEPLTRIGSFITGETGQALDWETYRAGTGPAEAASLLQRYLAGTGREAARYRLRLEDNQPLLEVLANNKAVDLDWTIEVSRDLVSWQSAGSAFSETDPGPSSERRFIGNSSLLDNGRDFFARLVPRIVYAASGLSPLPPGSRLGFIGAPWNSSGSSSGLILDREQGKSRLIFEVQAPATVLYQLNMENAGSGDRFSIRLNGQVVKAFSEPGSQAGSLELEATEPQLLEILAEPAFGSSASFRIDRFEVSPR